MSEELERWKQQVSELTQQLDSSRSDHSALTKRMEEQQTQIALQRNHMKKQLADQRKRLITCCQWRSHCGCRGCPDTPKNSGVSDTPKKLKGNIRPTSQ